MFPVLSDLSHVTGLRDRMLFMRQDVVRAAAVFVIQIAEPRVVFWWKSVPALVKVTFKRWNMELEGNGRNDDDNDTDNEIKVR